MLDTFKARLKAKTTATGVNLSKERITAIADRLHKKFPELSEEADHDAKLDELNELTPFDEIAKQDDKVRTLEAKTKGQKTPEELAAEEAARKKAIEDDANKDMPAWAKALLDQNKTLTDKISGFEKEKVQGTIKQQAAAKLKDIPAKYYENWQLPESEDQLDAFVEKVTTGYEGFKQDLTNQGLSFLGVPPAAGGGAAPAGKVNPTVKAFADQQAAKAAQQVQTK